MPIVRASIAVVLWSGLAALGLTRCTSAPANAVDAGSTSESGSGGTTSEGCAVATSCEDGGGFESAGVCTPCSEAPSYKEEIAPIINNACVVCHGPDGAAGFNESTYAQVYPQFGSMLSFVNSCMMPPLNGPAFTDAQRVALTAWLRCGAPDN